MFTYDYIYNVHMITYYDDPPVPGFVDFASFEVSNLKPVVAFSAETENILQATLSWDETKLARTNRLVKTLGSISSWKNHQDLRFVASVFLFLCFLLTLEPPAKAKECQEGFVTFVWKQSSDVLSRHIEM